MAGIKQKISAVLGKEQPTTAAGSTSGAGSGRCQLEVVLDTAQCQTLFSGAFQQPQAGVAGQQAPQQQGQQPYLDPSKFEPYFACTIDGEAKTRVKTKTFKGVSPASVSINEPLRLTCDDINRDKLHIELWQDNPLWKRDEMLGMGIVSLAELNIRQGEALDGWIVLHKPPQQQQAGGQFQQPGMGQQQQQQMSAMGSNQIQEVGRIHVICKLLNWRDLQQQQQQPQQAGLATQPGQQPFLGQQQPLQQQQAGALPSTAAEKQAMMGSQAPTTGFQQAQPSTTLPSSSVPGQTGNFGQQTY